jgi:hypothetical protein
VTVSAERRDRLLAAGLVALALACVLAYEAACLPRLTNAHFGDVEFTGWSGPLGSRLLRGDRPYVDFVLPIPPGSFLLLAAIEKAWGRPLLLHELWLNAAAQLWMGVLAYFIARTVTSRRTATFVSIATLLTVIQLNKECAYDHTAQAVAWASLLAGMRALFAPETSRSLRYWLGSGALAGFTLLFKQSTGIGAILAWPCALAYLSLVEVISGQAREARVFRMPLVRYLQGVGLGLAGVWGFLVLLGSTFRAFFQAVFLDGSVLKGGFKFLLQNLWVYLVEFPAYPASLALIAGLVMIGSRWVRLEGPTLHVGDEPSRRARFSAWEVPCLALSLLAGSATAVWFLVKGSGGYPAPWILHFDRLKFAPPISLVSACTLFVAHLVRTVPPGAPGAPPAAAASARRGLRSGAPPAAAASARRDLRPSGPALASLGAVERLENGGTDDSGAASSESDPVRTGHRLNAAFIAALVCSLLHNTSAPEFRPFYDNNAVIPLALLSLFVVLERARLRPLAVLYVMALVLSVGGNKYFRATTATTRIDPALHWAGMQVNEHGREIVKVATRVRELTASTDTVLVVPEDVQMAALIGRPRPPLVGAIVFVDQYAPRLAEDDIARLDENLPKVIVVHPREVMGWQKFFRIWSGKSGAERVIHHVLSKLLPTKYELDSSYPTMFLWEGATLDVYVRKDKVAGSRPPALEPATSRP